MIKMKSTKLMALFMSTALLLGGTFLGCSSGDDDDSTPPPVKPSNPTGGDGSDSLLYAGPESVETPDLSVAPATEGEIKINDEVFNGTFAEAVASITGSGDYVITLAPGTYVSNNVDFENPNANLKIKGLGTAKYGADVILAGKGTNGTGSSEGNRCTFEYNYNNKRKGTLILENLTIKNTYARNNDTYNTQNEAFGFDGEYCAAYNCGFFAYQDTVRTIGKAWFYGCYIEGDVDFMWMEKSGKVALYENCAIKTVWDPTNTGKTPTAHILAPGMDAADNFNKGLVVWNSAVDASVATNLFRNPWGTSETVYNIAAFVNIKFSGKENTTEKLIDQGKGASNSDLSNAIGYMLDKDMADMFPTRDEEIHVISEAVEKAEYNGRNRIINRIYKLNPGKYANDADVWDVNKVASDNGWNVVADNSKLDEVNGNLKANGVYKIDEYATDTSGQWKPITNGTSTDGFVSWTNILWHSTDYGSAVKATENVGTISVEVTGDSIVSFIGSQHSNGTVKVTDAAGNIVLDTYSTKLATDKTPMSIAYTGPATTLTLTFENGTTYIGDLTVSPSDGEKQAIKKVVVSGDDAVTKDDTITLKATVTAQYCAPVTVTWASSDESVAKVDENGVVTGVTEGEATITATSTFDSTKKASIKITVTGVPSSKAVFFASEDAGWDAEVSDTSLIAVTTATKSATGKNADGSDCTVRSWAYNASKNGIKLDADDTNPEKGEWYIEYPITAVKDVMLKKANIKWDGTGTGNFWAYVTYVDAEGTETVISDDKANVARNTENESSTFVFDKEIEAGTTAKIRISIHGDTTIKGSSGFQILASNKTPIWGKTEITCQATEKEVPTASGKYDFVALAAAGAAKEGKTEDKAIAWSLYEMKAGHGARVYGNDTFITVNVAGNCDLTFGTCSYNQAGSVLKVLNADGTEIASKEASELATGADGEVTVSYTGSATTLKITFNQKDNYYHYLTVTNK